MSFLFGTAQFSFEPDGTVNCDYIVTNSIYSLAQHVFPMAYTLTLVEPIWPMLQNVSKPLTHPNNKHHQNKIIINSIIIIHIIVSMILLHTRLEIPYSEYFFTENNFTLLILYPKHDNELC